MKRSCSDDSPSAKKPRKNSNELEENTSELEILTGFPADLLVEGKDFQVKAHAVMIWKSPSLRMIVKQPSNEGDQKKWVLDDAITEKAVVCFLRYFYLNEVDFDELSVDDYDSYETLLMQHMPNNLLRTQFSSYVKGKLEPLLSDIYRGLEERSNVGRMKILKSMGVIAVRPVAQLFNYYARREFTLDFRKAECLFVDLITDPIFHCLITDPFQCWTYVFGTLNKTNLSSDCMVSSGILAAYISRKPWKDIAKHCKDSIRLNATNKLARNVRIFKKYVGMCNALKDPRDRDFELNFMNDMVLWFTATT